MKIRAFVAEIFAKQYWYFLIIDFQCIFYISAIIHIRSPPRWIITEWWWNCFEIRPQNLPISVKWKHQSQLIFCILMLSHKHITFDTLRWTPCRCMCYNIFRGCVPGFSGSSVKDIVSTVNAEIYFVIWVNKICL